MWSSLTKRVVFPRMTGSCHSAVNSSWRLQLQGVTASRFYPEQPKSPHVALRYVHTRPLPAFKVERFWGWDSAKESLSSSECEPMVVQDLLQYCSEEELQAWKNLSLGYSMQSGDPELRALIGSHFFNTITAEEVTVVAPQEGIYLAMLALLSSNDGIIATTPCYQSLFSVAWSIGCNVIDWSARRNTAAQRWEFCVDELEALLEKHPRVKLLVVQFPNNPTGALPAVEEVERILDLCRRKGVWIFHDEMYRGLEHGLSQPPLPAMADMYPEKGISLGGLSKSFGLPGLRVGWLASHDKGFTSRVRELKDYTTICTASPSEFFAKVAIGNAGAIQAEKKQVVHCGLKELAAFVDRFADGLEWIPPQGGTFSVVTLTGLSNKSAGEYADELIHSHGLMLLPCSLFGLDNKSVRLCYGTKGVAERLEKWRRADVDIFSP